jgi:hypothetical protein
MSEKLSLKEALARLGSIKAPPPDRSASPVELIVRLDGDFSRPIDFALLLKRNGLTLSEAHAFLNALVDKGEMSGIVYPHDCEGLLRELHAMNLKAKLETPAAVATP